jgi:PAS domain S-box-containing protein
MTIDNSTMTAIADAASNAAVVVWFTDEDGVIAHANDALCRITGYASETLVGQTEATLDPEGTGEAFQVMRRKVSEGETWRGDLAIRRANGTTAWIDARAGRVTRSDGRLKRIVVAGVDASRAVAAEAALARSEQRMSSLVELSGVGAWSLARMARR